MIEYTNSLESALGDAKEHAAAMTTTQDALLKRLEEQQKAMIDQQNKFMQMMIDMKGGQDNDKGNGRRPNNRRGNGRRNDGRRTRTCNSCGKSGVLHSDDECFSLEKNKDKRPAHWREE